MKRIFNYLITFVITIIVALNGVNAASASKQINKNTCGTVYTNYYFFLEAMVADGVTNDNLENIKHSTKAIYNNNFYAVDFDENNIGYGEVMLAKLSGYDDPAGLSQISMRTFYDIYLAAVNDDKVNHYGTLKCKNGTCSNENKTKNFIVVHDWAKLPSNTMVYTSITSGLKNKTQAEFREASLEIDTKITLLSDVLKNKANPFEIQIDRQYTGTLDDTIPVEVNGTKYYLQPALYYIQYCGDEVIEDNDYTPIIPNYTGNYKIYYNGNASEVQNIPTTQYVSNGSCTYISNLIPTREGYRFVGWNTNGKATNSQYNPSDKYCGANESSITLYAIWEKTNGTYKIDYNTNTNDIVTNFPDDVITSIQYDSYITKNIPIREGYKFLGWSTNPYANEADPKYNADAIYKDRKDIVLYAIWAKKTDIINPETGITDYLLPFGSTIVVSGAGLKLLKKKRKNTFKQF